MNEFELARMTKALDDINSNPARLYLSETDQRQLQDIRNRWLRRLDVNLRRINAMARQEINNETTGGDK